MMKWQTMSWNEKFVAVAAIYGSSVSDCGDEELVHLWDELPDDIRVLL